MFLTGSEVGAHEVAQKAAAGGLGTKEFQVHDSREK